MKFDALLNESRMLEKRGRTITTVIVTLFLIHPTITTQMFNLAFRERDLDGSDFNFGEIE